MGFAGLVIRPHYPQFSNRTLGGDYGDEDFSAKSGNAHQILVCDRDIGCAG